MKKCSAVAAAMLSIALAGCGHTLVRSDPITTKPDDVSGDAERGGLVYSLPMTVVSVTGTMDSNKNVTYAVTPSILPDPLARYRLKFVNNGWADEDLNLGVDNNGLLTSTKANAFDRTGDIIVAVAKTIVAGQQPSSTLAPSRATAAPSPDNYPFTVILDAEEFVSGKDIDLPDGMVIRVTNSPKFGQQPESRACNFSVCFRTVVPVRARIVRKGANAGDRVNDFAFVAIDPNSTEGVDLKTATLVNRTNTLTFNSGLINSVQINEPSTALALVSLPLTVLKAILQVPAELLSLKITNVTDQASLLQQQANVMTQMKALIDAQKALDAARGTGGANRAVTGTGAAP